MEYRANRAICIGNFDGVHRGHREIISVLVNEAECYRLIPTILTFSPHPVKYFNGKMQLIDTPRKRDEILSSLCADICYEDFAKCVDMKATSFFGKILVKKLNAKLIVVGDDFKFGAKKEGDINLLKKLSAQIGIKCIVVKKVVDDENIVISSTRIRELIAKGDIEKVNSLLSRMYSLEGTVVSGDKRGKSIGYPTANLNPDTELPLKSGVYATFCKVGEQVHKSITYIGKKPTFNSTENIAIETFIFNFDKDIYGQFIEVFFEKFLRGEMKFKTIDDLLGQLHIDCLERGL